MKSIVYWSDQNNPSTQKLKGSFFWKDQKVQMGSPLYLFFLINQPYIYGSFLHSVHSCVLSVFCDQSDQIDIKFSRFSAHLLLVLPQKTKSKDGRYTELIDQSDQKIWKIAPMERSKVSVVVLYIVIIKDQKKSKRSDQLIYNDHFHTLCLLSQN